VIQSLLGIAEANKQLARERTRATVEPSLKIDSVGHDQFRGGTWRGRAQVGDEIADREIDFVPDRRDNRHSNIDNRARDNLLVELPQVFHAAAAAGHDDEVER